MNWVVFVAALLAAGVEFVEALTIVLAVGVTRGFRPALEAAVLAFAALAAVVLIIGRSLVTVVPLGAVQVIIGLLLLLFGIRWLRKAILRSGGTRRLHDEAAAFEAAQGSLSDTGGKAAAFATAFNGVFLEGVEVIFIVLALGTDQGSLSSAVFGALAGLIVVLAAGLALHKPLVRVPENALKFAVGLVLTTYGTFWAGEGMGVAWPGGDVFLLVVAACLVATAWILVRFLTSRPKVVS